MAGDMENIATAPRRHVYTYDPLLTFGLHVDDYLAESMRREGRGDAISQKHCPRCDRTEINLRCITCRDARLFCQGCMIALHVACPTHVIQHWNGSYFDKIPLRNLGMRYQVRHLIGEICPHPRPAFGNHFTIIDTNGIHDVALDFCSCMREHPLAAQLQRAWLFPATGIEPRTAVTTAALEQFQMLTFMGKISAYEYYYSLARLTDNTNTKTPSDNYDAFIRIVREWSFIRQLKRAGIGNDPGGWKSAKPASCAVECLACPRPGVNIPRIIDPKSPDAWVYTLYLGIDGNFRLERFDVSSEEKDPGLGKGLAYFVDPTVFRKHLQDFDKRIIQPASTCSNHEAVKGDKRTQNRSRDLAASGVGAVVCTRHELKLPLSTVDLRVGETQVEIDFGYLTAVKRFEGVPRLVTSYDIACQWSINLDKRIKIYGDHLRPQIPNTLYLVPKFHLPGHIEECQEKFCMSFHTQVGNNDGEAPEQGWPVSNGVAASTCEMGPGHRREKLDQHFGDYNWQKNISQGNSLLQKLKDAVPQASEHGDRFERFTKSLPQQDVAKWTELVEAWEADRTKPNPFARTVAIPLDKTEAAMHLQLAQEDAQDELAGLDGNELHTTSPKDMISQGIQLEASHSIIAQLNKELGPHSTDLQRAQVLEKSNRLRQAHMPVVCGLQIQDNQGNGPSLPVYSLPLYLPSSILPGYDLLHTIRSQLLTLSKAYKDGDTNTLTQKERLKCHKAKQYYCDVRKGLMVLSEVLMEWSWQVQLHDEVGISEGNRAMSWIWYSVHLGDVPGGVEESADLMSVGLRIEWCKARAWAHRWREESKLLSVEMARVKCTLDYEANLWLSRASSTPMGGTLVNAGEGVAAYAKRQASIRKSIRESFEKKWRFADKWMALGETDDNLAADDDNIFSIVK
ncbi:hypothetical protein IW261DRAFT_1553911 [Armillaria novae-zelandiae]|uniref:CxC2-like cysteine cluster KDZ transposase-associated domain-containing protein n=1 Tax=Armillaria novae-zelandiae TaxID=153914 RepID=A0AA39TYA8_9AGAR|nr:hypothetical protein IW261DRAFT_1553911 [Armillaria novae-zelandiae]